MGLTLKVKSIKLSVMVENWSREVRMASIWSLTSDWKKKDDGFED